MTTNQNIFDDSGWIENPAYPAGTLIKTVFERNGIRTFLLKLPAGFALENHSHSFAEQHLILQGECNMDGRPAGPGTYNCYLSGEAHGPFTSEEGALILVIWHP